MKLAVLVSMMTASLLLHGCSRVPAQDDAAVPWRVSGQALFPKDPEPFPGLTIGHVSASEPGVARISGRLLWSDENTARVFTPFNGRVRQILVAPGQAVARDQPLLSLVSSDYAQAQAEARKAEADLRLAQRQFRRASDLMEAGVIARKDFEQAEGDLQHADAENARTAARLRAAGERRGDVDGTFTLLAPVAGIVVDRLVNAGTEVRADASSPLFVITDPTRMVVQLDVPEMLSGALAVDQEVEFSISSSPGRVARARITHVSAQVDPLTQTVHARGVVLGDLRGLRGDSFIEARIQVPPQEAVAVRVPADAVVLVGDRHFVFTQQDRGYERVPVTIAALGNESVEVTGELRAGQPVVVEGALYLEQLFENGGRI